MRTSLIVTVRNEAATIGSFLDSVAAQTRLPDEIVIVDGGSTDRTLGIVSTHPLEVVLESCPCNIATGRNRAITLATGELIAVTDAGCLLDPRWFERITDLRGADVVAGGYAPVVESLFDACQYSVHNIFRSNDRLENFAISSRSLAFRKEVWAELGGYPEWLDLSEDTHFHERIRSSRFKMRLEPEAVVRWRMRPSLSDVRRQFHGYMRGDGKARQHTARHMIRLSAYAAGFLMLLMSLTRPAMLIPLALGAAVYLSQPVMNFRRLRAYPLSVRAVLIMTAMLLTADAGKITGYLSGLNDSQADPLGEGRRNT